MDDLLPLPETARYRVGPWAKASTLVAAAGWFTQLWFAARVSDINQGACFNVGAAFLLLPLPWAAGSLCWLMFGRSRRAGDVAFSIVMIGQGIALAIAGLAIRK